MALVAIRGNSFTTNGSLPPIGSEAPDFTLTDSSLADVSLGDFSGKTLILNIFPSIDTAVCATSTRTFNERAAGLDDVVVLTVSQDLPFALKRFCGAEGIEVTSSAFRSAMLDDYGVSFVDGPMRGLAARAVVVVGPDRVVRYTELVPELGEEPNYDAALATLV
jgi:thiol peroxidase